MKLDCEHLTCDYYPGTEPGHDHLLTKIFEISEDMVKGNYIIC